MRLLVIPIVSIAIATMMLLGNAQAVLNETGIITSQLEPINAVCSPYSIQTTANCTSWLHVVITPGRMYRSEWVTISDQPWPKAQPISVQRAGELAVYFQSYLTIEYINLVNDTVAPVQPQTLFGGVGFSYVVLYFGCSADWSYTITTNYIPSQYYNSETAITMNATAGSVTNSVVFNLGT